MSLILIRITLNLPGFKQKILVCQKILYFKIRTILFDVFGWILKVSFSSSIYFQMYISLLTRQNKKAIFVRYYWCNLVPSYLLKFWFYAWQIYPGVHYKLKTFLLLLNSSSKCNKMSYDWKHMKYNFKLVCISDLLFDW